MDAQATPAATTEVLHIIASGPYYYLQYNQGLVTGDDLQIVEVPNKGNPKLPAFAVQRPDGATVAHVAQDDTDLFAGHKRLPAKFVWMGRIDNGPLRMKVDVFV